MYKTELEIEGMMCSMCEAHIQDAIRKIYPKAKKVKADRHKKTAKFISEEKPDENLLKSAIDSTGYELKNIKIEQCK